MVESGGPSGVRGTTAGEMERGEPLFGSAGAGKGNSDGTSDLNQTGRSRKAMVNKGVRTELRGEGRD